MRLGIALDEGPWATAAGELMITSSPSSSSLLRSLASSPPLLLRASEAGCSEGSEVPVSEKKVL